VEVPNRGNRLKPGMYARVSLLVDERKNALVVPRPAVVDYDGKRGVWTVTGDNKAQFVPVELGMEAPERIEIRSGLKEGDQIVVVGAASLRADDTLMISGQDGPSRDSAMGGPPGRPQGRGQGQGQRQ
jgi:membrane fusion protein, multidrug efflux system